MRKVVPVLWITLMMILSGCSPKEPSIIKTYEVTFFETDLSEDGLVTLVEYHEMSDGTWMADEYTYKYRLEITGRIPDAVKDTTYVYLSNIEEIPFEEAMKASGLSGNMNDYFDVEKARFVALK